MGSSLQQVAVENSAVEWDLYQGWISVVPLTVLDELAVESVGCEFRGFHLLDCCWKGVEGH